MPLNPTNTPASAAERIRILLSTTASHVATNLQSVADLVDEHTRAAIQAELGGDAAELLAIFNAMSAACTAADVTPPSLP